MTPVTLQSTLLQLLPWRSGARCLQQSRRCRQSALERSQNAADYAAVVFPEIQRSKKVLVMR